jgi:spoIIIJ-associated protein
MTPEATEETPVAASTNEQPTVTQLEEEGEIAADYIEELLDITDLDGDIEIDTRAGRAYVGCSTSGAHPYRRAVQNGRVL